MAAPSLSVVIPVHNPGAALYCQLGAVAAAIPPGAPV